MEDKMNKIKYMNNSQKVRKERKETKETSSKMIDLNRNVPVINYKYSK